MPIGFIYDPIELPSPPVIAFKFNVALGTWTIFCMTKSRNAFSDALFLAEIFDDPTK